MLKYRYTVLWKWGILVTARGSYKMPFLILASMLFAYAICRAIGKEDFGYGFITSVWDIFIMLFLIVFVSAFYMVKRIQADEKGITIYTLFWKFLIPQKDIDHIEAKRAAIIVHRKENARYPIRKFDIRKQDYAAIVPYLQAQFSQH